jgi:hypothetical protein
MAKHRRTNNSRRKAFWTLSFLLVPSFFLFPIFALSHTVNAEVVASDDFDRAEGGLGSEWTAIAGGGMMISSQAVTGVAGVTTGDISTAVSYPRNQYSQIEVTSAQLTGKEWIGSAVRVHDDGQDGYVGIYRWNSGNPQLRLYKRSARKWTQLGNSYDVGRLAAGTQLEVVAVNDAVSLLENRIVRISVSDPSFADGAAGIMAYGDAAADNWSGGAASFQVCYQGACARGIRTYNFTSVNDGDGSNTIRVLTPVHPASWIAHNFLIVLPVQAGVGNSYGDGIGTLQALDAQDKYDLTVIEPSFSIDPWYADNTIDASIQYETYMTKELIPFIEQNLETTGREQIWLIGFSKSGLGAQDLILKHPGLFTLAASWDFPADMTSYNQYYAGRNYGTNANFQANYRLTRSFLAAHREPFTSNSRIWIGGYRYFRSDIVDYDALLTSEGIKYNRETLREMAHRWDSGWVPIALHALYQDSIHLNGGDDSSRQAAKESVVRLGSN